MLYSFARSSNFFLDTISTFTGLLCLESSVYGPINHALPVFNLDSVLYYTFIFFLSYCHQNNWFIHQWDQHDRFLPKWRQPPPSRMLGRASFLAKISVRSPQKLLNFIIWKHIFCIKVSKNVLIIFENKSTDAWFRWYDIVYLTILTLLDNWSDRNNHMPYGTDQALSSRFLLASWYPLI